MYKYKYDHLIKKLTENGTYAFFKKLTNRKIIRFNQKSKSETHYKRKTKFGKAI